ncbi:hypothetical protein [Thalassobaculum sp.]|uniref:hypothetical protein n=1 Tax=Thalassobaculum sp. TaxID=2022740 RepID=UPI0032ED894B
MTVETATRLYLLYVVMPIWLVAGFADYLCHRASRIAETSGWKESAIHILMLVQAGTPVLLGLLLDVNALVIAVMIAAFVLHEVTAHWDLAYAWRRREITPTEQHVHNYLAVIPFMAMSLVLVLHWPQALALIGLGQEQADWAVRFKAEPLPVEYVAGVLSAIAVFEILPYAEELLRGIRARRRTGGR